VLIVNKYTRHLLPRNQTIRILLNAVCRITRQNQTNFGHGPCRLPVFQTIAQETSKLQHTKVMKSKKNVSHGCKLLETSRVEQVACHRFLHHLCFSPHQIGTIPLRIAGQSHHNNIVSKTIRFQENLQIIISEVAVGQNHGSWTFLSRTYPEIIIL
jgi:hypothetical protein